MRVIIAHSAYPLTTGCVSHLTCGFVVIAMMCGFTIYILIFHNYRKEGLGIARAYVIIKPTLLPKHHKPPMWQLSS